MKANHFPGGGATINVPAGTYTLTIAPYKGITNANLTKSLTKP